MKLNEALALLKAKGIDPLIYGTGNRRSTECYIIEQQDGRWTTYYWERGEKGSQMFFGKEEDAVDDFVKNVIEIDSLNKKWPARAGHP